MRHIVPTEQDDEQIYGPRSRIQSITRRGRATAIEIPDARIHYELDQGSQAAFSDIEVVTTAYRPKHLRAKEQAGFRAYASSSDRAAMSARIEDEHHTLDWVLDL